MLKTLLKSALVLCAIVAVVAEAKPVRRARTTRRTTVRATAKKVAAPRTTTCSNGRCSLAK